MLLANKNITVVGMGLTGVATANFLISQKACVTLIDSKPRVMLEKNIQSLNPASRKIFKCLEIPMPSDLIVLSPGVDINASFLEKAREQGIQIISEIELASRFARAPIIAVTGTNGKSTVTTLIGDILRQAGKKIAIGGNLGTPFIDLLKLQPVDYFVLEVSTFQLEGVKTFRPNIAIILNITPDHLDRHKKFEEYSDLKGRISAFQTEEDTLILNKDDEHGIGGKSSPFPLWTPPPPVSASPPPVSPSPAPPPPAGGGASAPPHAQRPARRRTRAAGAWWRRLMDGG